MASSTLVSSTNDPDSSSVRPRNRRLISVESTNAASSPEPSIRGTARLAPGTPTPLRNASPLPTNRLDVAPPERGQRRDSSRRKRSPAAGGGGGGGGGGFGFGLLDGSWATGWGTVQDIAAGWLSGPSTENNRNNPVRVGSRSASHGRELGRKASRPWAQEVAAPANTRPTIQDVGAGIMAKRDAALIAARTASVLESHDGVNGGLDVAGRYKRRTSDDIARRSTDGAGDTEEILIYIHHVKPTDTYVGVILKYGCREEPFKKLNGLWSRDSLLTRKWVAMPVDACEVKGKPCAGPSAPDEKVDLLAPTPETEIDDYGWRGRASSSATQQHVDDIFGPSANGSSHRPPDSEEEEEKAGDPDQPWSHVRWVSLDSFPEPVEIGRVSRKAFGYFPPRRKRSLLNASSTFSTPRQSFDVQSSILGSGDGGPDRGDPSSRRQSTLSNRPNIAGSIAGTGMSTPASARSRVGSVGADTRPMWMRRPGGVGSLNQKVRTPGPDKDPLNTWAKKHFPSLILDNLPSMSVMGAETAHFGFPGDIGVIAESAPAESGRDAAALARQGTGFDRAAAAVETWLRGAFAKRPGTPMMGGQGQWGGDEDVSDLIELTDTQSEDDRRTPTATEPGHPRLPTVPRTGRDGSRGRPDVGASTAPSGAKLRATGRVASSASLGGKSTGKNKDD